MNTLVFLVPQGAMKSRAIVKFLEHIIQSQDIINRELWFDSKEHVPVFLGCILKSLGEVIQTFFSEYIMCVINSFMCILIY